MHNQSVYANEDVAVMITVIFIANLSMFVHRVLADSLFASLALIFWLLAVVGYLLLFMQCCPRHGVM